MPLKEYSHSQKAAILNQWNKLVLSGLSKKRAARKLGTTVATLQKWGNAAPKQDPYAQAHERLLALEKMAELEAHGLSKVAAAKALKVRRASLYKWQKDYENEGFEGLMPKTGGRPIKHLLSEEEAKEVRNRILNGMSEVMAVRTCCQDGLVEAGLAAHLLGLPNKHSLPLKIRQQIKVSDAVKTYALSPKNFQLKYLNTPRKTSEIIAGEEVEITPGDWFVYDDMTVNFGWWVPWPHGDCECSRRYGVRLMRGQLLVAMDVKSLCFLGFDLLARPGESYRGNDIMAMMGSLFRRVGMPRRTVLLEGGSWQSLHVQGEKMKPGDDSMSPEEAKMRLGGLAALGLKSVRSYQAKTKPIEGRFNFLQTLMEKLPGSLGRNREGKKEWAVFNRCSTGSVDPRKNFPSIAEMAEKIEEAMLICNDEPLSGKLKGRPREIWEAAIEKNPLALPDEKLSWVFARDKRTLTLPAKPPIKFLARQTSGEEHIYFGHESLLLIPIKGVKVHVYCDPLETDGKAVIRSADPRRFILPGLDGEPSREIKPGDLICVAERIAESAMFGDQMDSNIQHTKAKINAVNRQHRSITGGKNRSQRMAEVYDGFGKAARVESGEGEEAPAATPPQARRKPAETAQTSRFSRFKTPAERSAEIERLAKQLD